MYLFGEEQEIIIYDIRDLDYLVERLVSFPSFRPLNLGKSVDICVMYLDNAEFRKKFIEDSIERCPVLLYKLYKLNYFSFLEIDDELGKCKNQLSQIYFRNIGDCAFDDKIHDILIAYDQKDINSMMDYGFIPSSIEYCLKYDDIGEFRNIISQSNHFDNIFPHWSLFEWSRRPDSHDLLSFSGFFGSIKCFKQLLMFNFSISHEVQSLVVCSGSLELFHMVNRGCNHFSDHLCLASEFCQMKFIQYFIEEGISINGINNRIMI